MTARLVQKNILATIDTLSMCTLGKDVGLLGEGGGKVCYSWVSPCVCMHVRVVLQQYCKLNMQMDQRQYYSALKTLEQLEHTFLPPVKGYIFSDLLSKEIPKLCKSIQDKSRAELTVRRDDLYLHTESEYTHSYGPLVFPSFFFYVLRIFFG